MYPSLNKSNIAIIGLGYVGLPLAIEFASKSQKDFSERKIIGYDIDSKRIEELKNNFDRTKEVNFKNINISKNLLFTSNKKDLLSADIFIVSVPTPITKDKIPNLDPLIKASRLVGEITKIKYELKKNQEFVNPLIVFESTVYPGTTEEVCVPIIEEYSELKYNTELKPSFFCGYSPERINPGDSDRKLTNIVKITSGCNEKVSNLVDKLYKSIIKAGTFKAKSIKIAEASKIIENIQRDLNIALINEFSIIFNKLNVDTLDVLEAASTKWNFIDFKPGLVGGHCIGVDPYYLTFKAQQVGYQPEVVLAGRRINNNMGKWIAELLVEKMAKKNLSISKSNILILGFTFKENCSDIRNTRVIDIVKRLADFNIQVDVCDPEANIKECYEKYNVKIIESINLNLKYDAVICAVAHNVFKKMKISEWKQLINNEGIYLDIKGLIPRELNPIRV